MLQRIGPKLTVSAVLAISIVALVVAIRSGDSESTVESVADVPGNAAEESVADGSVQVDGAEVKMMAMSFLPNQIRVEAGTPIVWTNRDQTVHDVTASDGSWGSEILDGGDTFEMTFDEPGVYVYICRLHPPRSAYFFGASEGTRLAGGGGHGMLGTIIVE